ncbi:MAG: FAD-dependent oxidoreductase, partial [Dehalococcoidia bacterium]|nr:FAD-dependent oxidoreductase [Dehalococcoidia bacterium]
RELDRCRRAQVGIRRKHIVLFQRRAAELRHDQLRLAGCERRQLRLARGPRFEIALRSELAGPQAERVRTGLAGRAEADRRIIIAFVRRRQIDRHRLRSRVLVIQEQTEVSVHRIPVQNAFLREHLGTVRSDQSAVGHRVCIRNERIAQHVGTVDVVLLSGRRELLVELKLSVHDLIADLNRLLVRRRQAVLVGDRQADELRPRREERGLVVAPFGRHDRVLVVGRLIDILDRFPDLVRILVGGEQRLRRLVGRHQLRREEMDCHLEDVVAVTGHWTKYGAVYEIPWRSLTAAGTANLAAAGRCISVDHRVHHATKEIPACFATGEAAGVGAALALERGCGLAEVEVPALQARLRAAGAWLPGV